MAGSSAGLFLLAVLVGIASAQTTATSSSPWWPWTTSPPADRPCGEFPWSPANATVDCDYSYYSSNFSFFDYSSGIRYYGPFSGRCAVNCSDDIPVRGPPVTSSHNHYYYCHANSLAWLGTEPRCEDKPCGEFPWSPANATVDCDYSYYRSNSLNDYNNGTYMYYRGPFIGRCAVNCSDGMPVKGPSVTSSYGPRNLYYYCHVGSATWLGTEPRCEGKPCGEFPWSPDNATVHCDYSYYSARYYRDRMEGRCEVRCPHPLVVTGAPLLCPDGEGYFYCHAVQNATWLGQEPRCQDRPCGPFPWQPTDATVDCDYSFTGSRSYRDDVTGSRFYPGGRCSVICSNNLTVMGAPYLSGDGGNYYYCHPGASTWLGIAPSCQERPCGDFPWNTADVTVDCDYGYRGAWPYPRRVEFSGRCRVSCLNAELLVGPPGNNLHGSGTYYYCSFNNASWTGTEPVCIGGFDNSSVTESEANRVRLVGGEFYGCVELYDDVTQQWGPVTAFWQGLWESRMAWADLVCRDVGFTGGLATHAHSERVTDRSWLNPISFYFYASYNRPSKTGPNFFLNDSSPVSAGGVQHLYDTVGRVVRGDCTETESSWDCDRYLMCLACQKDREIQGDLSCNSTTMWVSFRRDDLARHNESSMHLRDPACIAEFNETHVTLSTALDKCGTTVAKNGTTNKIVYTNDVFASLLESSPDGADVITRTTGDRWTFNCHYVRDDSVAVGGLFPVPAPSVVVIHGEGTFTFSMNLYRSDGFSQPYAQSDFPVEVCMNLYAQSNFPVEVCVNLYAQSDFPVAVNDDVYFGISVEAAVSGLVLFVDNCKATPSSTPGGSTEYYIIKDGCHQDDTLQDFTAASSSSAHFGISAFKFTNESLPYVYLHCDVMVCVENSPDSRCSEGCVISRRRRRAADDGVEERATLVQGLIVLVPDETPDACAESCHLHASCSPSAGRCVCEPGWVGDGVHCQDFDECTIVSCGVHQRCVNTPGSHVCECVPGYMEVGESCQAMHAYHSTYRLLARSFSAPLKDAESQEYIDLVAEVVSTLESLYRRTSLAGDFIDVIIIAFRPGSVLVDHVINIRASADFSAAMTSEEVRVLVENANGTALDIDVDQIVITDYDECSDPEKTDCSPHAACLNTDGSFSCSCIMGYQDKSPDVASRPGRVCEWEGVSDSWVPAAAGAAAAAAVVIIAIATAKLLCRAKRKNRIKDVEGHDNMAFAQTATGPAETASSVPYRNDRGTWRHTVHQSVSSFEKNRRTDLEEKRSRRKNRTRTVTATTPDSSFPCSRCGRVCRSRILLVSHQRLTDKAVLITGCDTGFGNLLARRLDQLGLRVFAGCLTEAGVAELRQSCSERLQPIQMDITNSDSVQDAFRAVKEFVGSKGLWGLVNNAGILGVAGGTMEWATREDYQAVLNVNLLGMIDVTKTFLPLLKKSRGRIVNVASYVGRVAMPYFGPYSVSKFGVEAFSDSLRRAVRCFEVKVHIIEPGSFKTELSNQEVILRRMDHTWQQQSPETKAEYGKEYLQAAKDALAAKFHSRQDPVAVVDAMEHALCATQPRSRYMVGWDARFMFISWLPTDLGDLALRMMIHKMMPTPVCCKNWQ
ncbi:HSD17B6 [Branchiostoma lanceolatum]|uniref:HSD17B6 protein n=1 Tax=Branchiostoma lanceolatum TaxID=7740 RepID=A0A8J9ZGY7_BRALA|nr:HSD17B6 [Branchiostoma lanceolatum]